MSNWRSDLKAAFPAMFTQGCPMSCGCGWSGLLHELCAALQRETDTNGAPQVTPYDIKQKYGSLSFNARPVGSPTQESLIDFAERLSDRMCEVCGALGQEVVHSDGWVSTRCEAHRDARVED